MEELYEFIENKVKESGYTKEISGYELYNEICDFIEDKENGTYIFMSKPDKDMVMEYKVDVMSDNFNLSYIKITTPSEVYHCDFD